VGRAAGMALPKGRPAFLRLEEVVFGT